MGMNSLSDLLEDELKDLYSAENQLVKALPKMAKKATSKKLRTAFESHLEETRGQIEKLERVFGLLEQKVRAKHCDLIAMSTHGHRFISDILYGSVANEVRHRSMVPVLLVRGSPKPR